MTANCNYKPRLMRRAVGWVVDHTILIAAYALFAYKVGWFMTAHPF